LSGQPTEKSVFCFTFIIIIFFLKLSRTAIFDAMVISYEL